ncbi:MAG: nitroreductase family protein [Spirochaetales bacterium]|nr:nitroreductase family protein [Spirochaetales bacterium]
MEIMEEISKRRSIRQFNSDPVDKEMLNRILEAGRLAPSAKNRQPWRFIVIKSKNVKDKVKEAAFGQEHVGDAQVVIAACTTNTVYKMPNNQLSYPVDLTFAVSFMLLQAVHEGLGTCIITTFKEDPIKELLTVPHSMRIVMLLAIGYFNEPPAEEQERKSLKDIMSVNHW